MKQVNKYTNLIAKIQFAMPKQLRSSVNLRLLDDGLRRLVQLQVELACGWIGLKRKGGAKSNSTYSELDYLNSE